MNLSGKPWRPFNRQGPQCCLHIQDMTRPVVRLGDLAGGKRAVKLQDYERLRSSSQQSRLD